MRLPSPRPLPVLFELPDEPERQECWGRLLELRPDGAALLCQARLARGTRLRLRFELPGGGKVDGLEGDVRRARRDEDGYSRAEVLWRVSPARTALHRELLRLFAAS